jgi:hypothetical protein
VNSDLELVAGYERAFREICHQDRRASLWSLMAGAVERIKDVMESFIP